MKTIKGPALFLAQFAGDAAPFNSLDAICGWAAGLGYKGVQIGHGIAYVPRCLVYHDLRNGQLVDLFPEQVGKRLGIYAVYPFTRQPPNKVKLLIEHIRTRYLAISHYF